MVLGWVLGPGDGFGMGFRAQGMVLGWVLGPRGWFRDGLWGPGDGFGMGFGAHWIVLRCALGPRGCACTKAKLRSPTFLQHFGVKLR